jgi:hypothetical protein
MQYFLMMLQLSLGVTSQEKTGPETEQRTIEMVRALFVVEKQTAELSVALPRLSP